MFERNSLKLYYCLLIYFIFLFIFFLTSESLVVYSHLNWGRVVTLQEAPFHDDNVKVMYSWSYVLLELNKIFTIS